MRCPYCHEDRLIERIGGQWFCRVCAKTWDPENTPQNPVKLFLFALNP